MGGFFRARFVIDVRSPAKKLLLQSTPAPPAQPTSLPPSAAFDDLTSLALLFVETSLQYLGEASSATTPSRSSTRQGVQVAAEHIHIVSFTFTTHAFLFFPLIRKVESKQATPLGCKTMLKDDIYPIISELCCFRMTGQGVRVLFSHSYTDLSHVFSTMGASHHSAHGCA